MDKIRVVVRVLDNGLTHETIAEFWDTLNDIKKAKALFLEACALHIEDWKTYTAKTKQMILNAEYVLTSTYTIQIRHN